MASTPTPHSVEDLGDRRFSFYPPILNIAHNEWQCRRGSWSEILVWNPKMEIEIWIPRGYIGEVSSTEEPVVIVGLRRELEYKGGAVWPHSRRILAMPGLSRKLPAQAAGDRHEEPHRPRLGGLGSSMGAESRLGRLIGIAVVVGIAATFLVVGGLRLRTTGGSVEFKSVVQAEFGLDSQSDYFDVVRKLGPPETDKWKSELGERQYRALYYPKYDVTIILMGADRNSTFYIGAKDAQWRTVHSVDLPGGYNTDSMLRSLEKF